WIEGFMEYTSGIPSPEIFRRWAACSTLAGALERRVWTLLTGSQLYPNLFILLVGAPATGKSKAIDEILDFWSAAGRFNLAPQGMTKAAFVDQLTFKIRQFSHNGATILYNPMLVGAAEFGTLLPSYDLPFLNVLNDVYDCRKQFEDMTRGGDKRITVDRPHLNLIAGTQPKYLSEILPESAYGMGFCSRIVMVYTGNRTIVKLFKKRTKDQVLFKNLLADLKTAASLVGEFSWTKEAQAAVEKWNEGYLDDAPTHPLLQNYNGRRIIHAIKLSMTFAAARGNDLVVTENDFNDAKDLMLQAESFMPEVFKEMTSKSDSVELDQIHQFAFHYCSTHNVEIVPESKIIHFVSQRVPVNKVGYFIEALVNTGMLKVYEVDLGIGNRRFTPMQVSVFDK
ncbi:hypothetical protein LCGC14_2825340, partial [marine sediment metagenome]